MAVAALIVNIFALTGSLFAMNVYDRVVPNNAIETLWVLAIGAGVIFLFDLVLRSVRNYFLENAGSRMQVKLLRVLQEKEICMGGSAKPQKVDVRIIAGTNKNLQDLIKSGRFREDLYYRLHVIHIVLPPLRERGDDVLLLIRHFSAKYAQEMGKPTPSYTDRTLRILRDYPWPGNVRELENLVQRLMAMRREISSTPRTFPLAYAPSALPKNADWTGPWSRWKPNTCGTYWKA